MHGFNRVFRAILAVLEDLSNTYECSLKAHFSFSFDLHLTLGPLEVVDELMDVDIRHDEEGLNDIWKGPFGSARVLAQVVDLLVRLKTRDGYEALSQIELAAIQARGSVLVQTPVEQPTVAQSDPNRSFWTCSESSDQPTRADSRRKHSGLEKERTAYENNSWKTA